MRRNSRWLCAVLLIAVVVMPVWAGGLERGPIQQSQTVKEHRAEWLFATNLELLHGVADTTSTYVQTFDGCDEWPSGQAIETYAICYTQVPNSLMVEYRWNPYPGGTWSDWIKVDTMLAAAFTTGISTHSFKRLTMPAVKPWAMQFRDIQVDGSAACSTYVSHKLYTWPE